MSDPRPEQSLALAAYARACGAPDAASALDVARGALAAFSGTRLDERTVEDVLVWIDERVEDVLGRDR